ncbi:MAG: hypothetical protein AAFU41_11175 [Pseudomonadota bacterium]
MNAISNGTINASVISASAAVAGGLVGVGAAVGVSVARNFVGYTDKVVPDADHNTGEDAVALQTGDTVEILQGARAGEIYEYIGTLGDDAPATLDLSRQDYGNAELWKRIDIEATGAMTTARVERTEVSSATALSVNATASQDIDALTFAGAVAAAGGVVGAALSGTGVSTVNRIKSLTDAKISGSAGTGINAGAVTVAATNNANINADASAVAVSAAIGLGAVSVSVGVGIANNEITSETNATIEGATVNATTVLVDANDNATITADASAAAVSISGGLVAGSIAVGGATALNVIDTATTAKIVSLSGTRSDINTTGGVDVDADAVATIDANISTDVASLSIGAAGVAASIGFSLAENQIGSGDTSGVFANIDDSDVSGGTGDIDVTATMDSNITADVEAFAVALAAGGYALSAAGTGATVRNALDYAVLATVTTNSSLDTTGDIFVTATDSSDIDSTVAASSVAASVGALGDSISIAVSLSESTISNTINAAMNGSNASADDITVQATESNNVDTEAQAASAATNFSLGGTTLAGGGAENVVTITNTVDAEITGDGLTDVVTASDDVLVDAVSNTTVDAEVGVVSVAVGLISFAAAGGVVNVTATPTVRAKTDNITINADLVTVDADANFGIQADSYGVTASTGLSMGVNTVRVEVGGTLESVADGVLNVNDLTVTADAAGTGPVLDGISHMTVANAYASSGGLLLGSASTGANVINRNSVTAAIGAGADVNATDDVLVAASNSGAQKSEAAAAGVGLLIGAGEAQAFAQSRANTTAEVRTGANVDADDLTVRASGLSQDRANGVAGSGALVAGAGVNLLVDTDTSTIARIVDGATVTIDDLLTVSATQTTSPQSQVISSGFGLIGGTGAVVNMNVDSDVQANIDGVLISAGRVDMDAANNVDRDAIAGTTHIDGDAGGLASGAAAFSNIDIDLNTVINLGAGVNFDTTGDMDLNVFNEIRLVDEVALFTAGALSGAGAYTDLDASDIVGAITIGAGADIDVGGDFTAEIDDRYIVSLSSMTETYGAGTVAIGTADILIEPTNTFDLGDNANLLAVGDVIIAVGIDTDRTLDDLNQLTAQVDNFAGSAIPINDLEATAFITHNNLVDVSTGATLESYQNIDLIADKLGIAALDGGTKGTNWVSAVGDAIDSAFGGSDTLGNLDASTNAYGIVRNDGTIRTGALRNQTLIVNEINETTGAVTATAESNVSATLEQVVVVPTQLEAIQAARESLSRYDFEVAGGGSVSPDLVAYQRAQILRLEQEMINEGTANYLTAGAEDANGNITTSNTVVDPSDVTINADGTYTQTSTGASVAVVAGERTTTTIVVDDITAQAGKVFINADQMTGSGLFDTPGDASVNIENGTHAQLEIGNVFIPQISGGVFFNSLDTEITGEANATAANALVASENAENDGDELRDSPTGPLTSSFTFSAASLADPANDPEVNITNTFAYLTGGLDSFVENGILFIPPVPNITVNGNIVNQGGSVTIQSLPPGLSSNVIINGSISAESISIAATGTVNIQSETKVDIAGDEYAVWTGGTPAGAFGDTNGDVNGDNLEAIAEVQRTLSPTGDLADPNIVANVVNVEAEYINVNGLIRAGEDTFRLELDAALGTYISNLRTGSGDRFTAIPSSVTDNNDFLVIYDRIDNKLIVEPVTPAGGLVTLEGIVVSTRETGQISVYSGRPDIDIINNTGLSADFGLTIEIKEIDATTQGQGTIQIRDKARLEADGDPTQFTYEAQDSGLIRLTTGDQENAPSVDLSQTNLEYDPVTGYRYGWAVGRTTETTKTWITKKNAWLGLDFIIPDTDTRPPDDTDVLSNELIPNSNFFSLDVANAADPYIYNSASVTDSDTGVYLADYDSTTTWYGKTTATYTHKQTVRTTTVHNHSIKADYGISLDFFGNNEGSVNIVGGNADILVSGAIKNDTGTTSITTNKTITTTSSANIIDGAYVGGNIITLSAGQGMGSESVPLNVNQVQGGGGYVNITSTGGDIFVKELSDDLVLDQVSVSGGYDATIISDGSILARDSGSLITAAFLTMEAGGDIGASTLPLRIETGLNAADGLKATASGGIHVTEVTGDLQLDQVLAGGDVTITVTSGDLVDANSEEERDERARDALLNGVWGDLRLTADLGANDKIQDVKDTLADGKTREYQTYWTWREGQGETNHAAIVANTGDYILTAEETAYYTAFFTEEATTLGVADVAAYVTAAIQTQINTRTDQYRTLHTRWGGQGNTFDENFVGTLTQEEIDRIEGSIKVWTEDELLNGISIGILRPVTDTDVVIEAPNIQGNNITLNVSGNIGRTGGQELIILDGADGLTEDQQVLLGAAEPDDVFFLVTDRVETTVNFDAVNNTITRTDGTWDTDQFFAGMTLQVEGFTTQNATEEGPFYTIASVSGSVITLDASDTTLTATEVLEDVFVSGISLDPRGESVEATVSFTTSNTLTVTSGDISGLSEGMKLILSEQRYSQADEDADTTDTIFEGGERDLTDNDNDAESLYRITDITGSVITLEQLDADGNVVAINLTAGTDLAMILDQFVELKAVQVQLRDDIDLATTGALSATAGGQIFLGADEDAESGASGAIELGQVTSSSEVRVRASNGITSGVAQTQVNVTAASAVIEAGQGGIGTSATDRIRVNLNDDGRLTARANLSVYLEETDGDMSVGTMFSQTGDVDLLADGSILDAIDEEFNNIVANNIILRSLTGSVGTADNALDIETRGDDPLAEIASRGLLTVFADGDISVRETAGNMMIRNVYTEGGNVYLEANLSILDGVDVVDVTDIYSANVAPVRDSDNAIVLSDQLTVDITGLSITLDALAGGIGEFGNDLDINSRFDGANGVVTIQSQADANIREGTGAGDTDASIAGDLYLNTAGVDNVGATAYITATVGAIYNGALAGVSNVTSGRVFLSAQKNIGTTDNRIQTTVGTIQSISTTGSTYVTNDGDLTVEAFNSGAAPTGQSSGGEIIVTAQSPITVSSDIISVTDITLIATEDGDSETDDITVQAGVTVQSTGGNVTFSAGDDIIIAQNGTDGSALVEAAQNITFNIDVDGPPPGGSSTPVTDTVGARIDVDGTVRSTGGNITFNGNADADTLDISSTGIVSAAGLFTIDLGEGQGTFNLDNALITAGSMTLRGGTDNDTLSLTSGASVTATGAILIDLEEGVGDIDVNASTINGGSVTILGGGATDTLDIVAGSQIQANGVGTGLTIYLEEGQGTINVDASTLSASSATIRGGFNNDTFAMTSASSLTTTGDILIDLEEGVGDFDLNASTISGNAVTILGGGASDTFDVLASSQILANGTGAGLTIDLEEGVGDFNIDASTLTANAITISGGASVDTMDITSSSALTATGASGATTGVQILLGDGANVLNIDASTVTGNNTTVTTGADRDLITVTAGATLAATGALLIQTGADKDLVDFNDGTVAGSTVTVQLEAGDDRIEVTPDVTLTGAVSLQGGDDDDLITITELGTQAAGDSLALDGGEGTDHIEIQLHGSQTGGTGGFNYVIDVNDTGAPDNGVDTMTLLGTSERDVFLSRGGFVALLHGDVDDILDDTAARPDTAQRINYNNSINDRLTLEGLEGDDVFISDDNSTLMTMDGGEGADDFQFGQLFGNEPVAGATSGVAAGDDITTVETTRGFLSSGISYATTAFGGDGDDVFTVYSNKAVLQLEGEGDDDTFVVRAFIRVDGGEGSSTVEIGGGDGNDNIEYNINAPVQVDGGAGFDTVVAVGTEADDVFLITEDGVRGAGLNVSITNAEESIQVDGLEGDDTFFIQSTRTGAVTQVIGGLGSDTFNVGGDVDLEVKAVEPGGRTGNVTHGADSTDVDYATALIDGLGTTIADENTGVVRIVQDVAADTTPGIARVSEANGGTSDVYGVVLTAAPMAGSVVYVTVSANRSSSADRAISTPTMSADTLSFDGETITRQNGSWIDDGFDEYMSITLGGAAGDNAGSYVISFISADGSELTVQAAPSGPTFADESSNVTGITVTGQEASSVQVSTDGVNYGNAVVLAFDENTWSTAQNVSFKAVDDAAAEGERTVQIAHGVRSTDTDFDGVRVENFVVTVNDDDQPGLIVTPTGTDTLVLEGDTDSQITDSYTLQLTRPPADGEVITIDLGGDLDGDLSFAFTDISNNPITTLTFDSGDWDLPKTVTITAVAGDGVEDDERITLTHTVTSNLGNSDYADAIANPDVEVDVSLDLTVVDGDTAGVLIRETDGDTVVSTTGDTDSYTIRLTSAPSADVTINVVDDGQTQVDAAALESNGRVSILQLANIGASATNAFTFDAVADAPDTITRESGSWLTDGFLAGQTVDITGTDDNNGAFQIAEISEDGLTITLTGNARLNDEVSTTAVADVTVAQVTFTTLNWDEEVTVVLEADTGYEPREGSETTFTAVPSSHNVADIRGPLLIDGASTADRELKVAVMLASEDPGTLPTLDSPVAPEETQDDRLFVFNDGSATGTPGTLADSSTTGAVRTLLNGLGMGEGTVMIGDDTYDYGISYAGIEITEILLGTGNDDFTVDVDTQTADGTSALPITLIHGGGGADAITLEDTAADSLTVVFGDTDTDGARYNFIGGARNGNGAVFDAVGSPLTHGDTIDASALEANQTVALYGGIGADTLRGGAANDHIAGGGGIDNIFGNGGDDHIYGDSGFTVDLSTRTLSIDNTVDLAPQYISADTREAAGDIIDAGEGNNIVLSDYGIIAQAAGTLRLANTGQVTRVESTTFDQGGSDVVTSGSGNDIIMGGLNGDLITVAGGDNIVIGDHGYVDFVSLDGDLSDIDAIGSLAEGLGGNDGITTGDGTDIIIGGIGADTIDAGEGDNVVIGDNGRIIGKDTGPVDAGRIALTLDRVQSTAQAFGGGDNIDTGAGDDIVIGGVGVDDIDSTGGRDIVSGDGALISFREPEADGTHVVDMMRAYQTTIGDGDFITLGDGGSIVMGGVGSDDIDIDTGNHVVLADSGLLIGAATGMIIANQALITLTSARTMSYTTGGNDDVALGLGSSIVMGGFGDDTINTAVGGGTDGADIILGDNGRLTQITPDGSSTAHVMSLETTANAVGGIDTVTTGVGGDLILLGEGADILTDTGGNNIVLGDNGRIIGLDEVPMDGQGRPIVLDSIVTVDAAIGAGDILATGLDSDIVLGGAGADQITSNNGEGIGDYDSADILIGDHATISFIRDSGAEYATQIRSIDEVEGDDDVIIAGAGNDIIIGGTAADRIDGGADNDLIFGDHATVDGLIRPQDLPLGPGRVFDFQSISTDPASLGGDDHIQGGSGDDMILGQIGRDTIFGDAGDDDIIGGHNVDTDQNGALAHDTGDAIDGGAGDDVVLGDNGTIYRTFAPEDPRMRALAGTEIYGTTIGVDDGQALVTGTAQANPDGTAQRLIVIFDHSDTEDPLEFGDDYIAGGAEDDMIFGQLGDDIIQGDGSIDFDEDGIADWDAADTDALAVGAFRSGPQNLLTINASVEDFLGLGRDGDDYIEGNGGEDTAFGNLGQDDIVGGSSNLFGGLNGAETDRPDGSDMLFGGAGTDTSRNNLGDESAEGHARDADTIVGDNGNIYRLVGINGNDDGAYLTFNYDTYSTELKIIPRAVELLDYTEGGPDLDPAALFNDNGAADEIHGESGDDTIYGMTGSDVLFGDGQSDDIIGGWGHEWISGGTGVDGVIGDDGRIMTSRNSTTFGEELFGISALDEVDELIIAVDNEALRTVINVAGQLTKTVNLTPFSTDPNDDDNRAWDASQADDIIFGGWGDDFLHGGVGDDAISGAEALPVSADPRDQALDLISFDTPFNPGDVLQYDETAEPGTPLMPFFDPDDPRGKIMFGSSNFFLNFDPTEGIVDPRSENDSPSDGDDRIFGSIGNDAIMGGTGRDYLWGGYGADYINADDDQEGNNDVADPDISYEDFAFGGAGEDILIANTIGDRLVDWRGEFNSYYTPFQSAGEPTVINNYVNSLLPYLYDLGAATGADPTRANDAPQVLINGVPISQYEAGEPFGELGIVVQSDSDEFGQQAGQNRFGGRGASGESVAGIPPIPEGARLEPSSTGNYVPALTGLTVVDGATDATTRNDQIISAVTGAERPGYARVIGAVTNSEIVIDVAQPEDDGTDVTTYVYDPDTDSFVAQNPKPTTQVGGEGAVLEFRDEDDTLFAYIDENGGLWIIDDLKENREGQADPAADDWILDTSLMEATGMSSAAILAALPALKGTQANRKGQDRSTLA